jgi:hypothetical protein
MTSTEVRPVDALKTYQYLRLGMIGAVVLLGLAIGYEIVHATNVETLADPCAQTSISAYYYTPVGPIFIGCMFLVGLALIAYKGHYVREDLFLNVAGMLAPVVAVVPTTAVGYCYSIEPDRNPLTDGGSLAQWVVYNVHNNIFALLAVGFIGVAFAWGYWFKNRNDDCKVPSGTLSLLLGVSGVLVFATWLWNAHPYVFLDKAHGTSANAMFFFLWLAIWVTINEHQVTPTDLWRTIYLALLVVAVLPLAVALMAWLFLDWHEFEWLALIEIPTMLVYGIVKLINNRKRFWAAAYLVAWMFMIVGVPFSLIFGAHQVFALEAWEILAFLFYWGLQTWENWKEEIGEECTPSTRPRPGRQRDAVPVSSGGS